MWWHAVLVGLMHTLPLLVVNGEPVHQRRSLEELLMILTENKMNDTTNAEVLLSRCGYLRCQSVLPNVGDRSSHTCNKNEIQKALRDYQRTYNLPATGKLDEETKLLMSTSRCGNQESEKNQIQITFDSKGHNDFKKQLLLSLSRAPEQTDVSIESSVDDHTPHTSGQEHKNLTSSKWNANSKLYRVLARKYAQRHPTDSVEKINSKRQGLIPRYTLEESRKRNTFIMTDINTPPTNYTDRGIMFNKRILRWRLLSSGYSQKISVRDSVLEITLAFRVWSQVTPLRFIEDNHGHINDVDIEIAFGRGEHQNCYVPFDHIGGQIAHSWNGGNIHLDDDEDFKAYNTYVGDGIRLHVVLVHEIGHVLGLDHNANNDSVMHDGYDEERFRNISNAELRQEDKDNIQEIYGVCTGSFDAVFDYVAGNNFHTFFFRRGHCWVYSNELARPFKEYPIMIASNFPDVPDNVDGFVNIRAIIYGLIVTTTYFFQGEDVYLYDTTYDRVVEGWPLLISEVFPPKPGATESIPSHIDSVIFERRDQKLYFFKNELVYVYDPMVRGSDKGCCVRISRIVDEYPSMPNNISLPSNLDAVYYSYTHNRLFFFKGNNYWRNVVQTQPNVTNSVQYMGLWNRQWKDICDCEFMLVN